MPRSGDPGLQCPGCGKQFKSVRWLEWHKENKCSVTDKRAKLDEFSLKVQKLHVSLARQFETRYLLYLKACVSLACVLESVCSSVTQRTCRHALITAVDRLRRSWRLARSAGSRSAAVSTSAT